MILSSNKVVAKNLIKEKSGVENHLVALIDKRKIINNTLYQLASNKLDREMIAAVKNSQEYIKGTSVDLEELEDMQMTHEEIQGNLRQADKIYKEVAEGGVGWDEGEKGRVEDELFRQLEEETRMEKKEEREHEVKEAQEKGQKEIYYN